MSSMDTAAATESNTPVADAAAKEDPYIWLEDVESEESLNFAKDANDKCLKALGDPTKGPSYDRILKVLESQDRIPHVGCHGRDEQDRRVLFNFWKDEEHPKGIWRKTTEEEYKKDKPQWETILDVDKLAEEDGISWVWKGSTLLPRKRDPTNGKIVTRALLSLSRGGSDAAHLKEFDLITQEFVPEGEGFRLPEAKTRASYKSRDVLLVGSDFGAGSLTDSGYPRIVKEWVRGTSVEDAPIVFEGEKTDVAVNGYIADERNWGGDLWQVHSRSITFYTSKYWLAKLKEEHLLKPEDRPSDLPEPEFKEMDIQADAEMNYLGKLLFISLRSDWTPKDDGVTYKQGSLIYCELEKFWSGGKSAVDYKVLFEPTSRTAYEYFTATKNYLILSTMDTVKSKLEFFKLCDDGASLSLVSGSETEAKIRDCSVRPIDILEGDEFWFTTNDFTTPSTLFSADATKVETSSGVEDAFIIEKLKSLPPQYDSDDLVVEQHFATSKDGTEVPYFMVRHKDLKLNGKNPTLLYGYGGFEISLGPHYIATAGLAWLERGGVYVEANIRGGGEFGPGWHQAALQAKRNKAYEDFIAVGEHLISSGICTSKTLAARGGSNGGLLMGNMYVMRPDLWGALHCAVPLLDMKRFHTLLAGASWMAEYGNPDKDWDDFLYKYSPYHNIDESRESYPPMLVTTSTRDDRVHPGHARKMVKKLWDLGAGKDWPIYYYENIEGGHGGAADAKQSAFMTSLAYDFMFDTLSKNAETMS
ncbi:serine protease, S9A family peptidase [Nitzschia inconspicua]|uniref:Serine protease, S9A family peptidase n=1 Tax=Nitzschia inconspicua TaxID=303405 RepID=A0A9K3PHY2_9STRA|nr:serine protease, S9A family peptidase [Nitzschia inconspicua]